MSQLSCYNPSVKNIWTSNTKIFCFRTWDKSKRRYSPKGTDWRLSAYLQYWCIITALVVGCVQLLVSRLSRYQELETMIRIIDLRFPFSCPGDTWWWSQGHCCPIVIIMIRYWTEIMTHDMHLIIVDNSLSFEFLFLLFRWIRELQKVLSIISLLN